MSGEHTNSEQTGGGGGREREKICKTHIGKKYSSTIKRNELMQTNIYNRVNKHMINKKRQLIQLHTFKFEEIRQTNTAGLNNKDGESVLGQLTELSLALSNKYILHLLVMCITLALEIVLANCADVNMSP